MTQLTRRHFLSCSAALLASAMPAHALWPFKSADHSDIKGRVFKGDAPTSLWKWSREARFYKPMGKDMVACGLCPNRCVLSPGDRSVCRSRVNLDGKLYTLVYGNPCAVHVDPVEKKPLYHFYPETRVFSLATTGCNFRCLNCQNWEISQAKPEQVRHQELFPAAAVDRAQLSRSASIAYTYSEPTTYFEYMLDVAHGARAAGLKNLWVSNGYINHKPLLELCRILDGANINLKAHNEAVYRRLNGGRLQPVLNTFKTLHEQRVHFEMTNLVIPGYTDDEHLVVQMCQWILTLLGPNHPLHFLRFFPRYKLDRLPPTPVATLTRFRELALQAGIRYVYVGNVPGHTGNNTYCHHCGKLLIERRGYAVPTYALVGRRCKFCDTVIPGVWPLTKTV